MAAVINLPPTSLLSHPWHCPVGSASGQAFDTSLKEHVIATAYASAGTKADASLLYLANRLSSRHPFLQFSSTLMGSELTQSQPGMQGS